MKQPEQVRAQLLSRWERDLPHWAMAHAGVDVDLTPWPISVALGAPTQDAALTDLEGTKAWVRTWSAWSGAGTVRTAERSWRHLGRQRIPTHLDLVDPAEVAGAVGRLREWRMTTERLDDLVRRGLTTRLDGRTLTWLRDAPQPEWQRLLAVLDWVDGHATSGLLPRQLPIPGVDSKWFERHQRVLTALRTATGRSADLGLRVVERQIAVRVPDTDLADAVGGLATFSAAAGDLAQLSWGPHTVLLCENLQSALAFDVLPGTVVMSRQGYAVDVYAQLPWVHGAHVIYWGDLDTHGFAILNRLRSYLPGAVSVVMDAETLLAHRDLWVTEEKPTSAALPLLTAEEQAVYRSLQDGAHGDRVRLEQERVGWEWAASRIESCVRAAGRRLSHR